MELLVLLLTVVAIILFVASFKKNKNERAEKKFDKHVEYLTERYGNISQCIPYLSIPDSVFVFEKSRHIVIGYAAYQFDQILDVKLDVITHYSSNTNRTIRDVIIGNMMFGTLGALAAIHNASNDDETNEYVVSLVIDSLTHPVIKYRTNDYEIADMLFGIVRAIIARNKSIR